MIPNLEVKSVADQNKKIHPHKFILWVGIGSIIMMFAGLTSAYIVKREAAWLDNLCHTDCFLLFNRQLY